LALDLGENWRQVTLVQLLQRRAVPRDLDEDLRRRARELVWQEAVDDRGVDEVDAVGGQQDGGSRGVQFVDGMKEDAVPTEMPFLGAAGAALEEKALDVVE